ncbi:MAG: hypothetical protein J6J06_05160 [Bacteroidaceae bacterium]|nr:hypothetical protein [Bacteroidaceae bacterium]
MDKEKFVIEYDFKKVSPTLLWGFLSTAPGLEEWFADKVESNEKEFTFYWNKTPQVALLVSSRVGVFVRFHWIEDDAERAFFEMRITTSELTGATMLSVTDFATPDEMEDLRELWDNEIERLQRRLGVL